MPSFHLVDIATDNNIYDTSNVFQAFKYHVPTYIATQKIPNFNMLAGFLQVGCKLNLIIINLQILNLLISTRFNLQV